MSCPTCRHTMQNLGVKSERVFWCPRCGTVRTYTGDFTNDSPTMLTQHVRRAEEQSVRTSVDGRTLQFAIIDIFWRAICEAAGAEVHPSAKGE